MSKYAFPLDPGRIEYIFAPYYDHEHSHPLPVEIDKASTATVTRETEWCWTKIIWTDGRPGDIAVMGRCIAPFDAYGYDALVATFSLPESATIEFALIGANRKVVGGWSKPVIGTGSRQELFIDINDLLASGMSLRGRARILGLLPRSFAGVAFRISSSDSELGVLTLIWLGLRNSEANELVKRVRALFVPDWSPWIVDRKEWGEIIPQQGLIFGKDALPLLRHRKSQPGWKENFTILEGKAHECLKRVPEEDLGDYLPNHDLRYTRYRETPARALHWDALVLAFVGMVNSDDKMIGHALRYLMCMLHTQHWADSAEHRVPSSTWNQRSFMEEMTTTSVAILIDWLGFALTPQAKSLARHALWTRGMAHVQRDLFQYDYMHHMNQGAVFCRALVLGGLAIEQDWPRASGVADDAYRTMKTVLKTYIKPDGGISEGPGYLCQTLTATLWAIIAFSRARGLDWRAEASDLFGSVESYVRVMAAGEPGKCVPSGDCRLEWFSGDGIPMLASVFPDSAFGDILMNCLRTGWVHEVTGTIKGSGGMVGMVYGPDVIMPSEPITASMLWMPDTGKFSRTKLLLGRRVRLWVTVSVYGATHSHLDHGAFSLEIDEVPVFVDLGMVEYWKSRLIHQMKRSFAHNTLTPIMPDGSWADQSSLEEPIGTPVVTGETPVLLRIPGQEVWPRHLTAYERVLEESADPQQALLVRDIGELCAPGRVAFHLHSPHAFVVRDKTVTAEVAGVQCTVHFPWAHEVSVRNSIPDFAGRDVFHICAMTDQVTAFTLETMITME